MSLKAKLLKGTLVLTMGEMLGYGASFVRNMILARMLTKADFGIAAAFALVVSMLEFTGKLAIGQLVVQDRDGDKTQFIATAHAIQFVVALLSMVLMLILARPLASFLNLPGDRWAFQSLALIPLFKGLEHLDVRRFGRELRFIPASLVEIIPQVLITLAAYPLALWLKDYRTVLILLLAKGAITCVGSHYLAEHPYRWHFELVYIQRIFRFGWPLIINSLLMVAIFQGDQFLVGRYYSMADLAVYAAAASLTLVPGMIFAHVFNSSMLPIMAQVQHVPDVFNSRYRLCIQLVSAFSAIYALFMIIGAEWLMRFVYGIKYSGSGILLSWMSVTNAMRIIRYAPTIAALAKADTMNQTFSNFLRAFALIPVFMAVLNSEPLWIVAALGLIGECFAFIGSLYRLSKRDGTPVTWSLYPASLALLSISSACGLVLLGVHSLSFLHSLLIFTVMSLLGLALFTYAMLEWRTQLSKIVNAISIKYRLL